MEAWQAFVLGIVEGITEYLPVSSTGHLILFERMLGIGNDEASRGFTICIQSGAILAVVSLYWPRVKQMARGIAGRDPAGLRLLGLLALAFVPAAAAGLLFEDAIDRWLFGLMPVTIAWLVGGLVILGLPVLRAGRPTGITLEGLDARRALAIGLFQCLALVPGTSRSLATIAGALIVGLASRAAIEFSLLLGVVTLCAATAYKGLHSGPAMLEQLGAANVLIGVVTSFVAAFLAVKWLVAWLGRHGLFVFAVYRIGLALVVAALLWRGMLDAR